MITYQKPLVSGFDGTLIANAREALIRETSLGGDWRLIRIGAFFSFVGLADDNGVPAPEQVALNTQFNDFHFGMIDGTVTPGFAGGKYLGMGYNTGQDPSISQYSGGGDWRVSYVLPASVYADFNCAPLRTNGATVTRGTAMTGRKLAGFASPVGVTDYFSFLCLSLDVRVAANFTLGIAMQSNLSDSSYDQLMIKTLNPPTALITTTMSGGGWWSPGVTPVGLTNVYFRVPWFGTRLRLHNIAVVKYE